jgi:ABC-type Na+ efflux pump permease subunit
MVLPIVFMVVLLVASALWAIPGDLSSPDILLPLLGLASLLPAGLAGGVAADLIAGERERRSLETLLCAPASPFALVVGKSLSILLPAVGMSWISIGSVWWALASRSMAPSLASTLGVAMGFAPMATVFSLGVGTWMSARSRTVRAAAQMSALTTVPLIALSQAVPLLTPSAVPAAAAWCAAGAALGLVAAGIYGHLRQRLKPHRLLR